MDQPPTSLPARGGYHRPKVSEPTAEDAVQFLKSRPQKGPPWICVLIDTLQAEYGLSFQNAFGGTVRKGKRKVRVWGYPIKVALTLWPAMLSRHGGESEGLDTLDHIYLKAAMGKRDELERKYHII